MARQALNAPAKGRAGNCTYDVHSLIFVGVDFPNWSFYVEHSACFVTLMYIYVSIRDMAFKRHNTLAVETGMWNLLTYYILFIMYSTQYLFFF